MNSDVMHSKVQLEGAILKNLIAEVKETVAIDVAFAKPRKSSFGAIHLWNMRRNSRYAAHPRNRKPTIVTGFGY